MSDLLIKNGTIATADDVFMADLRCRNGLISEIAPGLKPKPGEDVLDAYGLLVLPGGVDPHTHMDLAVGDHRSSDDFYTGTIAAACGGTTTIIDHLAFGPAGASLFHQLAAYHQLAAGKAVIDYAFHAVVDRVDESVLADLPELPTAGVTSLKFYMTYDRRLNDSDIIRLLTRTGELGILACTHCEDDTIIQYLKNYYLMQGKRSSIYHARSRPDYSESSAVTRLVSLAHTANDAPIYIVHTSTAASLHALAALPFTAHAYLETCPQYLLLDESSYLQTGLEGLKYIASPPLRKPQDNKELWLACADGRISTIGTDHCPFNFYRDKLLGADDFSKCPNGLPGVELRMAQIYSEGVAKKRFNLQRFVQLVSTRPAQLFGIYPQKGTIKVGSDADICIFDPYHQVGVTKTLLHENVDYTPYEGQFLTGYPQTTISHGQVVMHQGRFLGAAGRGRFVHCGRPQL